MCYIEQFWRLLGTDPSARLTAGLGIFGALLTGLSFLQRESERKLAARKQLTELLEKLTSINTEIAKFRYVTNANLNPPTSTALPPNFAGLLSDQRRFLVRQAAFIARAIRARVSPYEYLLIAEAFDGVDDPDQAEGHYTLAVDLAKDPFDKILALRGRGRFLFNHQRLEEGREQFSAALACLTDESDRTRRLRAETYERWAVREAEVKNYVGAHEHLSRGIVELKRVPDGRVRRDIDRLEAALVQLRPNLQPGPSVKDPGPPQGTTA
jgi:tetratricopeptide (TPR) repeat protein